MGLRVGAGGSGVGYESRANQGDLCSQPGSGAGRDCHTDHQRETFTEATSPAKTPQETTGTVTATNKMSWTCPAPGKPKAGGVERRGDSDDEAR